MKSTVAVLITTFFLISGCSSDGGGSAPVVSPDPTLPITSNNAMQVSKITYEAALESQQLGNAGGGGLFIASAQGGVAKIDTNLVNSVKTGNSSSGSQVPIPPEIIPCAVSGTQTISGDIADPITPTLTPGDFFQLAFNACDEGLGEVTNGTMRMDIDAFSGDLLSGLTSMTVTVTLTSLQISIFENQSTTPTDVFTSNGGATLTIDATSLPFVSTSINGESLVVDTSASSESQTNFLSTLTVDGNLLPSPYTTSASGTLDSTQLAGIIRYSNPFMFEGLGSDYPSSGEFLVEGLGSSLRLIADNNVDVRILIDLGADGTIDETIVTTWAELAAP
jgi:hypothetical protein